MPPIFAQHPRWREYEHVQTTYGGFATAIPPASPEVRAPSLEATPCAQEHALRQLSLFERDQAGHELADMLHLLLGNQQSRPSGRLPAVARTEDPDILALDEEGDGVLLERVPDRLGLESRCEVAHFPEAHSAILAALRRRQGTTARGTGAAAGGSGAVAGGNTRSTAIRFAPREVQVFGATAPSGFAGRTGCLQRERVYLRRQFPVLQALLRREAAKSFARQPRTSSAGSRTSSDSSCISSGSSRTSGERS